MSEDDIIDLADKAGSFSMIQYGVTSAKIEWLQKFASLVAKREREKVAAWMIERSYATGHGDSTEDLLTELEWQIRESEREACAKVCDDWPNGRDDVCLLADAIRARGDK